MTAKSSPRMPLAELVSIPTSGHDLDGLLYRTQGEPRGGVLLMHGNMRNFYSGPSRFLPPFLVERGYDCLAFNRRAHDILTTGDDRLPQGGAYQTAAEGIEDNDRAAAFLAAHGHPAPIVVGHSNGGVLAAAFAAAHHETRALVLMSAHAGGREHVRYLTEAGLFGADRHEELLRRAEDLVARGRGHDLLQIPGWWYLISAESYVDRVRRTPSTVEMAPRLRCPVLFLKGEGESNDLYPAEGFAARAGGPCDVVQFPDCDHFYTGHHAAVGKLVGKWLDSVVEEAAPEPAKDLERA